MGASHLAKTKRMMTDERATGGGCVLFRAGAGRKTPNLRQEVNLFPVLTLYLPCTYPGLLCHPNSIETYDFSGVRDSRKSALIRPICKEELEKAAVKVKSFDE